MWQPIPVDEVLNGRCDVFVGYEVFKSGRTILFHPWEEVEVRSGRRSAGVVRFSFAFRAHVGSRALCMMDRRAVAIRTVVTAWRPCRSKVVWYEG